MRVLSTGRAYALPLVNPLPDAPAEALHGGSVMAHVEADPTIGLTSVLTGQGGGVSRWFDATLTVNAGQLEIDGVQGDSLARYDLELWSRVTTTCRFAQQILQRLLFRSNRDGRDAAVIIGGGELRNRWDIPCRADGKPFGFAGSIELFALLADASGFHVLCLAAAPPTNDIAGFALENVYLKVRPPGRLALLAHGDSAPPGRSGIAVLVFDVAWALPTLPDPYAWNLQHTDLGPPAERSLRVVLTWEPDQPAAIAAHLDEPIAFPNRRSSSRATMMRRDCRGGSSASWRSSTSRFACSICRRGNTCSGWRWNDREARRRRWSTTG